MSFLLKLFGLGQQNTDTTATTPKYTIEYDGYYVTAQYLMELAKKYLPTVAPEKCWVFDTMVKGLPLSQFGELNVSWLSWLRNNQRTWMYEVYDCDDFAEDFRSHGRNATGHRPLLVIGWVRTPEGEFYHAWNAVLTFKLSANGDPDWRLWEYEPQTGTVLIDHLTPEGWRYIAEQFLA